MIREASVADVAGTRLAYDIGGEGPDLVLIHGFGGDRRVWDAQMLDLASGRRVLRYDVRGFGRSAMPDGTPYSHAGDLAALLDRLGIVRATLAGISMGGFIATHFAVAYPGRVERLVLASPALSGHEWSPDWKTAWRHVRDVAVSSGAEAARDAWLDHKMFQTLPRDGEGFARMRVLTQAYSGWHWLNPDCHAPIDPPDSDRLARIQAPTLVVGGAEDMADFRTIRERLASGIPDIRVETLAGVGHMVNLEAPEPFNRLVAGFV